MQYLVRCWGALCDKIKLLKTTKSNGNGGSQAATGAAPGPDVPAGAMPVNAAAANAGVMSHAGDMARKWSGFWANCNLRLAIWAVLLLTLILLPIKIGPVSGGHGPNAKIPLIGDIESVCATESDRILATATKAYVLSKTITQSLSLMRNVQFSAGFVSVNPGSVLTGAIESIERVADALFIIMAVMLVEKFSLGVIFWICFKVLFVGAIILRIVYEIRPYELAAGIGAFLARMALVLLLFFPVMSFITNKIDAAYQPTVAKTMTEVEQMQSEAQVEKYLENVKDSPERTMLEGFKDKISGWLSKIDPSVLAEKAKNLRDAAERQTDKLFNLFAGFTLSVVIIPLLMIAILWKVLVLLGSGLKGKYQRALERAKAAAPRQPLAES